MSASNILNKGVEITGKIEFANDLQIDGKVDGEIKSQSGTLVVDKNADIKGNIIAGAAIIHGKVDGSIKAEKCQLKGESEVKGDVVYKTLGMEEGASLSGRTERIA